LRVQAANDREFLTQVSELISGGAEDPPPKANTKPQGASAIVPEWIRDHVLLIHILAKPLAGQGKVIATCFGEDPNAIDPKTGKPGKALRPRVIHAAVGETKQTLDGLATYIKRPHNNLYMPLAVFRPDLDPWQKGYERDVVASLGIVADFDDAEAARWAERLPSPPNYVLETSAGRFQAFYLFDKPEPPELVKPVAERLKAYAGCDHGSSDISHVWRIPGTLNWPNAKKVAAGRPSDPQLVRWVKFDKGRTSLQVLSDALPEGVIPKQPNGSKVRGCVTGVQKPVNGKGRPRHSAAVAGTPENLDACQRMASLPPDLQVEIKQPAVGDRSKSIFKVIAALIALKLDDQAIENLIYAHPKGIGAKYANRDDLDKEIARVREKTAVPAQDDKIAALVSEMNRASTLELESAAKALAAMPL